MSAKIIIPDGLRPLLESLAREIIRNQPTDIYLFSSLFFDILLKLKHENGGQNPIDHPELCEKFKFRLVQEAINRGLRGQKVPLLISSSDQKEGSNNVDQAATKIQAAARGFISRRRVKNQRPDLESARTTRQFTNDAYDPRRPSKRLLLAKRNSDAQISKIFVAPQNLQNTKRSSYTSPATSTITEEDAAATKIQANVRGFLTRRKFAKRTDKAIVGAAPLRSISNIETGEPSKNKFQNQFMEPSLRIDDVDTSASKIQAGIRGYLTRKHLEEQGIKVHHPDQSRSRSRSPNTPLSNNNDESRSLNSSNVQIDQQKQPSQQQQPDILKEVIRQQETAPKLSEQGKFSVIPLISKASSDVDVAASKIQAGVRGFLTRKHMEEKGLKVHHPLEKRTRSGSACVPEIRYEAYETRKMKTSRSYEDFLKSGVESEKRHVENAASKIQAGIRGFLTRKHLNEQGVPVRSPQEIAQQADNRKESLGHDFPPVRSSSKNETRM